MKGVRGSCTADETRSEKVLPFCARVPSGWAASCNKGADSANDIQLQHRVALEECYSEPQHVPSSVDGRAALDSAILAVNYAKIRRNIPNNLATAEEDAGDGGPGARSVSSRAE